MKEKLKLFTLVNVNIKLTNILEFVDNSNTYNLWNTGNIFKIDL